MIVDWDHPTNNILQKAAASAILFGIEENGRHVREIRVFGCKPRTSRLSHLGSCRGVNNFCRIVRVKDRMRALLSG